jgi:DNA repair exonuclease SbcCD ATPase subunit
LNKEYNQAKLRRNDIQTHADKQKVFVSDLLGKISSKKNDKNDIILLEDTIKRLGLQLKPLIDRQHNFEGAKLEKQMLEEQIAYKMEHKVTTNLKKFKDDIIYHRGLIKKQKPKWKELKIQIDNLKWAINDALGNKGLKAYIFDSMLQELNNLLKYYEQFIGYRIEFNVDLDSANKDIYTLCYIDKHQCLYEELSGAQAQLVDIATSFALNDLVTQGRPMNIMVFDEVMDNLDEENEDIVYDLITNKSLTTTIFLITHSLAYQNASTKIIRMGYNKKLGQTLYKA